MTQRTGGFRYKTRHKLQKKARDKGKISITRALQKFEIGDKVRIVLEPAIQKGMPHPKNKNRIGTIVRKQGNAYVISIKDFKKPKEIISAPVHLRKV